MITEQVANILKVGLSGLAFLLMLLTYYLLVKEQKREQPDLSMLKAIKQFSWLALVFVFIVGGFSIAELFIKPSAGNTEECHEAIERIKTLSQSPEQTKEELRELIDTQLKACE